MRLRSETSRLENWCSTGVAGVGKISGTLPRGHVEVVKELYRTRVVGK